MIQKFKSWTFSSRWLLTLRELSKRVFALSARYRGFFNAQFILTSIFAISYWTFTYRGTFEAWKKAPHCFLVHLKLNIHFLIAESTQACQFYDVLCSFICFASSRNSTHVLISTKLLHSKYWTVKFKIYFSFLKFLKPQDVPVFLSS